MFSSFRKMGNRLLAAADDEDLEVFQFQENREQAVAGAGVERFFRHGGDD
jgi:hypothetical protein